MQWISDALYNVIGEILTVIWYIRKFFWELRDRAENQYLVRAWMPGPLNDIAGWFSILWDKVYIVKQEVSHYRDFLNDLWGLTGLNKLITWIWDGWESLKRDPKQFIVDRLDEVIPGFDILRRDPWEWLHKWLYNHYYELWRFLDNPGDFVSDWINAHYPKIYKFWKDPLTEILEWINAWNHSIYVLLKYPDDWIKGWLQEKIGLTWEFWIQPGDYILRVSSEWIDGHMETIRPIILRTGEKLARYIWAREI